MIENFEIYYKIIIGFGSFIFGYHKYLMKQLDKKIDKENCIRQQELLSEKRATLEILIEERTRTQFNQLKEIREDLKIIKEKIIEK